MKKFLISFVLTLVVLFAVYRFREPVMDALPIDQSGWSTNEYGTCYLDEKGDPLTGWQEIDGQRYYFVPEQGNLHTGWLEQADGWYYLDAQGRMQTGWLEAGGNRCYLDQDGRRRTGLLELDGQRYYLDEMGMPCVGFFRIGEEMFYFTVDGSVTTGWVEDQGVRYYLNDQGGLYSGWLEEDGLHYFFREDGTLATGWLVLSDARFYMNDDGSMATGWTEIDGESHYFDENGLPYTGWTDREGENYYFSDGILHRGWLEADGKKYYLKEDGTPARGKLVIDGEDYFFSSTGMNFIMVNPWHDLPEGFTVELVSAEGARLDPACQEALTQMLADCRAAGFSPMVKSSYRSIADQQANLNRMVESMGGDYAAATQIVAVPGTSEHHLGLAFDIVDTAYTNLNHQQATRPTQKWLMENCWNYGFILRYPENTTDITGIIWEPWHYRYVGVELAKEIQALGGIPLEVYIDNLTNDGTTCGGKLVILE